MQFDNKIYDKIHACWMGKNIGGTLGGPYEGMKERLSLTGLPDIGENGPLPIITRASQAETLTGQARRLWELEAQAADLHALALPKPFACGREYTAGLIKYEPKGI